MPRPGAEPSPTSPAAWLAHSPWLAGPELAALCRRPPRTLRHQLARLVATGQACHLAVEVAGWPRCHLYALAGPADPLPAPQRLVRLELLRALHSLLLRLTPPGTAPALLPRLCGEPDGPPVAAAPHPLAGLADAWLQRPAAGPGRPPGALLVRWDEGERHEAVERRWLAALLALAPYTPPVVLVCATAAAWHAWHGRLAALDRRPPLTLVLAADLAHPYRPGAPTIWRDAAGRPAGLPRPMPLPAALLTVPAPPPSDRRLTTLAAHRLALSASGLAALRTVAQQPLLTVADLAWFLDVSERAAFGLVAALARRRLLLRLPASVGSGGGTALVDAGPPRLWLSRAGVRLLAAVAGEPPARYRHQTGLGGGAVARPGQPGGNRLLGRLARHPRHTLTVIRLRQYFLHAVRAARRAGRPVDLLVWQGPTVRPVFFPTGNAALVCRPVRTGRGALATVARGKVEPDARAQLAVGARRLTLLIEVDGGSERARRLQRKLRHYAGWGASPAARHGRLLVITTTAWREGLIQRLAAAAAEQQGVAPPPLWTTTFDALAQHGPLAPIWWTAAAGERRALAPG